MTAMDPTLQAADAALEESQDRRPRPYLGASSIGHACHRKLWFGFRWASSPNFTAKTLKMFADGHSAEDVQASRLRMVEGIDLWTHKEDGSQYGFVDCDGHFRGHYDGVVVGLLHDKKTPHIWEHKSVGEPGQRKLEKLIEELGERSALKAWNEVYFAQAQIYMHKAGLNRHYLTVSSPGCRHTISCLTELNESFALSLLQKADGIIASDKPPTKISADPAFWVCKFCDHYDICQLGESMPAANCRTCVSSSPINDGKWHCNWHDKAITEHDQRLGCEQHLFIPDLVPFDVVDASAAVRWVRYRTKDGFEFKNATIRDDKSYSSHELQHLSPKLVGDTNIEMLRSEFDAEVISCD